MAQTARYSTGVAGMMAANLCFSAMAILIRFGDSIPAMQISLYRFVIGAMFVVSLALLGKTNLRFSNIKDLIGRGLIGGLSVVLYFLSINGIGLAKASLIGYSYPVFAIVFSYFILKERPGPFIWPILLAAIGGLVLLNETAFTNSGWGLMVVLAWIGAILAGLAVVLVKRLTATDSATSIFLSQCIGGFWIIIIPANLTAIPAGWESALIILAVGLLASVGQIIMTWSYGHVPVSIGSVLGTLVPVLNVLAAVLFFGERFSLVEGIGAAITLSACLALVLVGKKAQSA